MKTLLIVRHAKSSWDNADMSDIDRPLNDRGKRDAPVMAQRVVKTGVRIDRFVSSPAKRARQTAEFFVKAFGRKENEIVFIPELYHASMPTFKEVVGGLDNADGTVALFSHNPGITAFVNILTEVRLDNMPTCGVFAVKSPAKQWSEFLSAGPQLLFFDYPKAGLHD
ncbi:MAG TPA: histidine phosphatase family protein [Puia sp.]|jgi:phosphohistidine phosphatase|nr:histidine phosphatase family protein [Puia sp.]